MARLIVGMFCGILRTQIQHMASLFGIEADGHVEKWVIDNRDENAVLAIKDTQKNVYHSRAAKAEKLLRNLGLLHGSHLNQS